MFLVYFAGELVSSKHLMGDAALADAIAKVSSHKFSCVLPQTLEDRETTAHRWLAKMPGPNSFKNEEKVMDAFARKQANRLLP
jgi:hypothetical protein